MIDEGLRLAFLAEWLDPMSGVLWRYQLFFYPATGEVELFDIKNRRHFLRRVRCDGVSADRLYPGATCAVFARQMRVTEFGDEATRRAVEARSERTLAMVKPDAFRHAGAILEAAITGGGGGGGGGLQLANLRMARLSREEAAEFYAVHADPPFFEKLVAYISSGPVVAMELVGPGAVGRWRALLGPTDPARARAEAPGSIRAAYGTDTTRNAAHGSDSPASAAAELAFFFGAGRGAVGRCASCSPGCAVALVKPHAVAANAAGRALSSVQAHFDVTALRLVRFDRPAAAEFLEVYRGALGPGEWAAAVDEISSGDSLAIEVVAPDGGGAVEPLRALCGPSDPELARALRPGCLRAALGASRARNGVHCTDLPEDGALEAGFLFATDWVK